MEVWDLVDSTRKPIGKLHTRGEETAENEYHVVVEILTVNADGRILLTQRDEVKTYPLLWETTGGSIIAGETSLEGALRELEEETGLVASPEDMELLGELKYGNHFLDSYIWKRSSPIQPEDLMLQQGEVCDAKLVSLAEFEEMNRSGLVVTKIWDRFQINRNRIMPYLARENSVGGIL